MITVEERVAGEMVRFDLTIGVLEAVARQEPNMIDAIAALHRASLPITRVVCVRAAEAAGMKDADRWFDAVCLGHLSILARIAINLLGRAFAEVPPSGKDEAAGETTATAS